MARNRNDKWPSLSDIDAPVHDLAADDAPEKMKVLYIRLPGSAHRAIKGVAAERGQSLETWVRVALNRALMAEGRDPSA